MSSQISCEEDINEIIATDNRKKKVKKDKIEKEHKIKIEESIQEFFCPIGYEIMENPVIVIKSGWTYERSAIENWITENGNDLNTRQKCTVEDLIPNRTLRDAIVRWKQNVAFVKLR
eukprot:UN04700